MFFRQLYDLQTSTYTYLLADEVSREAVLIDPVYEQAMRDEALLNEMGIKLLYTLDVSWLLIPLRASSPDLSTVDKNSERSM